MGEECYMAASQPQKTACSACVHSVRSKAACSNVIVISPSSTVRQGETEQDAAMLLGCPLQPGYNMRRYMHESMSQQPAGAALVHNRSTYMRVGVELIHNQLAVLHARALPELSLSAVCSCCYNYCLTDLASDQHLCMHRACLIIDFPDSMADSMAMQDPDGTHLFQKPASLFLHM